MQNFARIFYEYSDPTEVRSVIKRVFTEKNEQLLVCTNLQVSFYVMIYGGRIVQINVKSKQSTYVIKYGGRIKVFK